MKKGRQILLLLAVMLLAAGCSPKQEKTEEPQQGEETKEETKGLNANSDPQEAFEAALAKMAAEKRISAVTQEITSYNDGVEEEQDFTCTFDREKEIIERLAQDPDGIETIYHCFNLKEDGGYGVYTNDEMSGKKWVHYIEDSEEGVQSEYEYWAGEFDLSRTEENGHTNIEYTNEGEEELNDETVVKIRVNSDERYDSGEKSVGEVTRESVLKEHGWSEDEVALVDGFSKILDDYVEAMAQSEGETTVNNTLTVWIGKNDGKIRKSRTATQIDSAYGEDVQEAIDTFNDEYWMVDMIHLNIEDGMSPEEAKALLEEDLQNMEDAAGEAGDEYEDSLDSYAEITKVVTTKNYKVGEDCPQVEELPKDAKEVDQTEYYEGGEGFLSEEYVPDDVDEE